MNVVPQDLVELLAQFFGQRNGCDMANSKNEHRRTTPAGSQSAREHTEEALDYMAQFGVEPEGEVRPFLPPSTRQQEIDRLPYDHDVRQEVVYETEPGEFSAVCPFSGLPDAGTVRVTYVPGDWILELKSLKYYFISWRDIGITQEDLTAHIFGDILKELENPEVLTVTTEYNVRGGINTTCTVDSREQ